ncbi:hypothetical protein [Parvibium lacunae]|uniref:CsbD family protein n=1 Tax=Parvibium lacunae TaxID=1888893 RepID=A0A368L1U6_9BURK|nr:hypothetical protein [Parvibium lacunae]RCS57350.1 hypothetical protein DU000_07735 [Parvibium lacunae]
MSKNQIRVAAAMVILLATTSVYANTNVQTSDHQPVQQAQPEAEPSKPLPNNKLGRAVGKVEAGAKRTVEKVEAGVQHVGSKVTKFGEKVGQTVEQKADKVKTKVNAWVGDDGKKSAAPIEDAKVSEKNTTKH